MTRLEPVHPGEVLKHDFMEPFGLSATALAKAVGVTPARINEIARGRRGITAETALRLARYFNTDARSWMNLQDRYELEAKPYAPSVRTKWRCFVPRRSSPIPPGSCWTSVTTGSFCSIRAACCRTSWRACACGCANSARAA